MDLLEPSVSQRSRGTEMKRADIAVYIDYYYSQLQNKCKHDGRGRGITQRLTYVSLDPATITTALPCGIQC